MRAGFGSPAATHNTDGEMSIEELLRQCGDRGLQGLTIFKSDKGYQASITFDRLGWCVEHGATPDVAVAKVLASKAVPRPMAEVLGMVVRRVDAPVVVSDLEDLLG